VNDTPDIHPFPASKLADFLRAMEDPEGSGRIDAGREREIARIEQRLAEATQGEAAETDRPEQPDGR
jgi:hypothetical protein